MGIGTVFVGLISIVIICKIMGALCSVSAGRNTAAAAVSVPSSPVQIAEPDGPTAVFMPVVPAEAGAAGSPAPVENEPIPDRRQIIAAVTAAIAEDLGTDITGIRVLSFKKV
jgi:hypothetical protein